MKIWALLAAVAATGLSGGAFAACDVGAVKITDISTTLANHTVCVKNTTGGWEAQEEHGPGNQLWDFKMGNEHRTDPRTQIGTWTVVGDQIKYNYDGGSAYSYTLFRNLDGKICFDGVSTVIAEKVVGIGSGCQ
jgi:hypothetical protein